MEDVREYECSCPGSWVKPREACDHIQPLCIDGHCMACGAFDPLGELTRFHDGKTRRTRDAEKGMT
jgi:hypothetical protein